MLHLSLRRSPAAQTPKPRSGAAVITVTGTLDGTSFARLDDELRRASAAARIVILDLRALWTVDLDGAAPIAQADERIRADGGRLVVVRGGPDIERCFTRAGLDGRLEIVDRPPSVAELRAGLFDPAASRPGLAQEPAASPPRRLPRVLAAVAAAYRRSAPEQARSPQPGDLQAQGYNEV